ERTRHGVAAQLSAEAVRKRGSVYFADGARDAHLVAGDSAGEISRGEVALVSAHKLIALLLHIESVLRRAGDELDLHVPATAQIAGGCLGSLRFPRRPLRRKDLMH